MIEGGIEATNSEVNTTEINMGIEEIIEEEMIAEETIEITKTGIIAIGETEITVTIGTGIIKISIKMSQEINQALQLLKKNKKRRNLKVFLPKICSRV